MTVPATAVPLDAPYYNAPIGAAFTRFFTKYGTFSGRASRSEYWWWYLISVIVNTVFNILAFTLGGYGMQLDGTYATPSAGAVVIFVLWGLWALAVIVPSLALLARRLHDTDRSAGWIFIGFVPFVGGIILLVFTLLAPVPAGARFDR
ncbi:DUF805 domain-containing protein [Herbiconiux moechotypicola]|uniref:DUF805 domain-containing protein n=1 Tax=Herbiconiux moechotypicola TaxID=637393 RepID=A0ABN3E4W3_9MICO|nr:DUF805 domain-containing protein [Herbiconiux moechotypicola]MCS5731801.1 DUF805 domain-containing protein [Herbiconiux moechotypicola]